VDSQLQALIDRTEIENLLVRYAAALDGHDWELLASCFTTDAQYRFAHMGDKDGVQAIVEVCRASLEPLDASQHLVGSPHVEIDGDRARSRCSFQAQHVRRGAEGGRNYLVGGTYVDELLRTGDGWRIERRELQRVWTDGNPAVLGRVE
jgi:3-phenylpropionate/cinnamic acid dioxygenase small subunit